MRKAIIFILLIALSILCLIGCVQEADFSGMGQVNLTIDTGYMKDASDIVAFNVVIMNSDGVAVLDHSGSMRTQYSISVPAGNYTATVESLDDSGHVIGRGSASAEVSGGQTSQISVPLTEVAGSGTVSISISCNVNGTLTYLVSDESGAAVGKGALGYCDGLYSSSAELQNGHYSLAISFNGNVVATEPLRVYAGKTVHFSAELDTDNETLIVIENGIIGTPGIEIKLDKYSYYSEDTLRASATISGIDGVSFCWVVDDMEKGYSGSYSDLELPLAGFRKGSHSISLIVSDGSVIWSGDKSFTVGNERVKLRVLNYIDLAEPNSADEISQIWDSFAELHPEIELIREDLFGERFHQKVEAYAAQGQLPDVMYAWPSGRSSTLHTEGLLYDLTSLLKRDGLFDKYNPLCTAPQLAGYLGELPNGVTATSMMFVNNKVLRDNGLSIPKTYADLKAMVPVLNAKGIEVITMDCQDGWVMQSCLFSLIAGRFGGADWADRVAAGEIDFEDDWFKKALTVVDNLYKDGIINRNTLSISYGSGRADFAAGKSAFYIDGDWACGSFQLDQSTGEALFSAEQQANDVSLMNFPALDGEIVHESNSAVVGTGWAIAADIDPAKLEAAWTLVKYLEGEYVQTWRLVHGEAFPSLTTLDVDDICEENNLEPLVAKRADWYNRIQVATPVIDGVLDPAVYEVINTVLAEIGLGRKTVDSAAADVNTAWQRYYGLNSSNQSALAGFDSTLIKAAQTEGELVVYGSCEEEYLAAVCTNFEKLFGIKTTYQRLSTGEVQAKIEEEKGSPSADVFFGGTTDPYNMLASEGLLERYDAKNASHITKLIYKHNDNLWYGIYTGILGFMYNIDELQRRGLEAPEDFPDLLKPEYKGLIWLSNYNTAGTAKQFLNTAIQKYGHDAGIQYLVDLDNNIEVYTKSGSGPSKNVGTGECVIGIGFLHDGFYQRVDCGYDNIGFVIPSSGSSCEIGATAIFKGAKHSNAAKLWIEYALSPNCVNLAKENGSYQFLVIDNAEQPQIAYMFGLDPTNVIDFDSDDAAANTKRYIQEVMAAFEEAGIDIGDSSRFQVR